MFPDTNSPCFSDCPLCPLHLSGEWLSFRGAMVPHPWTLLITLYRGTSLSSWCCLLMQHPRFQLMAVDFLFSFFSFESLAAGNPGSPSSVKHQNRVSKIKKKKFMLLNKNYPCEWEKSIPCKKVISQNLLMNQWTKASCHRLDCSCLLYQGWKFKEEVKKELDWESRHPDFC